MGKQRGAPAGEGCWIPAGAKAASGRDGERAVACARHGGRDTPLGLLAAFPMERRDRAAPVPGAGRSRAGWGPHDSPQVWVPAWQPRQSRSYHRPSPKSSTRIPIASAGSCRGCRAPHVPLSRVFPRRGGQMPRGQWGVTRSPQHMAGGRCCRRLLAPAATRARSSDSFIKPPDFPIPLFLTSVSVSD